MTVHQEIGHQAREVLIGDCLTARRKNGDVTTKNEDIDDCEKRTRAIGLLVHNLERVKSDGDEHSATPPPIYLYLATREGRIFDFLEGPHGIRRDLGGQ